MLTTALLCMALNIYHEARGELIPGQYAVGQVTWRRAGKDEKKVCAVVLKPHQFSWTTVLVERVPGGYRLKRSGVPREAHAWDTAVIIAKTIMTRDLPEFADGATFYHERRIRPHWAKAFRQVRSVGNHVFYRAT